MNEKLKISEQMEDWEHITGLARPAVWANKVAALEAKLEAIRAAAMQFEDDLDGTAFLDREGNDAHDLISAQDLWAAAQEEQRSAQ